MNELYDNAIEADKNGTLNQWMIEYLHGSGRNANLAEGLRTDGNYHTRLIDFPLAKFKLLLGPDRSYRYYEEPEKYYAKVDAMVESLEKGWKPVPLISTDIWNDGLELNDGAHRAVALMKFGVKTYPTVFYFKDQNALDIFLDSL